MKANLMTSRARLSGSVSSTECRLQQRSSFQLLYTWRAWVLLGTWVPWTNICLTLGLDLVLKPLTCGIYGQSILLTTNCFQIYSFDKTRSWESNMDPWHLTSQNHFQCLIGYQQRNKLSRYLIKKFSDLHPKCQVYIYEGPSRAWKFVRNNLRSWAYKTKDWSGFMGDINDWNNWRWKWLFSQRVRDEGLC